MSDNNANDKNNYLKLDSPQDVQDLICDILTDCRDTGDMVQYSGKICNLLQVWLKCYQIQEIKSLAERVTKLEEGYK